MNKDIAWILIVTRVLMENDTNVQQYYLYYQEVFLMCNKILN